MGAYCAWWHTAAGILRVAAELKERARVSRRRAALDRLAIESQDMGLPY